MLNIANRGRGRPAADISWDEVMYLVECGFTWVYIADRLGYSVKTI